MFHHGFVADLSKLVLERPLDLLSRNRVGKYDLHGLGILCRNHRARRPFRRAESRLGRWRASDSRNWDDAASSSLLQRSFPGGTGPNGTFAGRILPSTGPRTL